MYWFRQVAYAHAYSATYQRLIVWT